MTKTAKKGTRQVTISVKKTTKAASRYVEAAEYVSNLPELHKVQGVLLKKVHGTLQSK
jgi:hypothetical protein